MSAGQAVAYSIRSADKIRTGAGCAASEAKFSTGTARTRTQERKFLQRQTLAVARRSYRARYDRLRAELSHCGASCQRDGCPAASCGFQMRHTSWIGAVSIPIEPTTYSQSYPSLCAFLAMARSRRSNPDWPLSGTGPFTCARTHPLMFSRFPRDEPNVIVVSWPDRRPRPLALSVPGRLSRGACETRRAKDGGRVERR